MNGIELFKSGSNSKQIKFPSAVNDFIEYKPTLYIEFLKLVFNESSDSVIFNISKVKVKDIIKPIEIVYHGKIKKRDFISIDSFFSPNNCMPYQDENGNKFVAIASSEDNGRGGILVGVDSCNCDEIFKYRWEESDIMPSIPFKLSNNIFEFISEIKTMPMWEKEYDRSKLFKSFTNDFYEIMNCTLS